MATLRIEAIIPLGSSANMGLAVVLVFVHEPMALDTKHYQVVVVGIGYVPILVVNV
jgi:hypothetical protein